MTRVRASALAAASLVLALPVAAQESALGGPPLMAAHRTLLAAALPPAEGSVLGALPVRPEDLAAALPPPPQEVVLENSYANVTVNHAAHLARRASCKTCHGPGPIQKIGRFSPRQAHETCRGCHQQLARGPTDCRGCHVKKPEPATVVASGPEQSKEKGSGDSERFAGFEETASRSAVTVAAYVPGAPAGPFDAVAATAAFDAAEAWPAQRASRPVEAAVPDSQAPPPQIARRPYARRSAFVGLSVVAATNASLSPGVSLGVTFRQDRYSMSDILEWSGTGRSFRARGLIAAGFLLPVHDRWTAHLQGVGGFDAMTGSWTSFLPALGARGGFEWTRGGKFVQSVDLSLTAISDVTRPRDPLGNTLGGTVVSFSASAGFDLTGTR